jgi:flagellar assembly factor FliW
MKLAHTRFGTIEFEEARLLTLPGGLIGFSGETRFVFVEPQPGRTVAWLQSVTTPELAFPVIAAALFGDDYPTPALDELARRAKVGGGKGGDYTALVVVASQKPVGWIANLLAPIVVNIDTRVGAQVVLDPLIYSAASPFDPAILVTAPPRVEPAPPPSDAAVAAVANVANVLIM